jgi:hypothetical protein
MRLDATFALLRVRYARRNRCFIAASLYKILIRREFKPLPELQGLQMIDRCACSFVAFELRHSRPHCYVCVQFCCINVSVPVCFHVEFRKTNMRSLLGTNTRLQTDGQT